MTTVRDIRAKAGQDRITMVTAYDGPAAEIVDDVGVDIVLFGDSLGNTTLGYDTTLPVTVVDMARHVGAVARSVDDA
ncbi:MAG: 3-methyl-2-oxobutanoate hydroxymethyltransferase, partial [Natronomonas sp.]